MAIKRYHTTILRKLAKLPQKRRNRHISQWPDRAFIDIRKICKGVCSSPKLKSATLKKVKPYKAIIRNISRSQPAKIKKILLKQKGRGIFTALATGLVPLIVDGIVKLTQK